MSLSDLKSTLQKLGNKKKAAILQGFFKTGAGEYAEGDIFLGITVPVLRTMAKKHRDLTFKETLSLLQSSIHEERFLSLLILILKYRSTDTGGKKTIYEAYLKNTQHINNWDLVDVSAKHIIGDFLKDRNRAPLYALAHSDSLWERRIAIISTFHFIENNDFEDTFKIAKILIADPHDLIHKAVGWMLREAGKRNIDSEEKFLKRYYKRMPRTMLRYAIERFPETKRQSYLQGNV
ncbi:MAG: DNA alkylation repair protein [Candidatus Omnitrophica bacterium]|nr:DNA alkylation repair protein [Candidatus Omnitrophota bacterium]